MLGISPLFRQGIICDIHSVPFMYYDLPTQDVDQLDLPISPHGRYYIKFASLNPTDDPQTIIRTKRERLRTFYSINAQPQKEVWSWKRITKIVGYGNKVQSKFDLDYPLHRYFISQNRESTITISDADFPSMNPGDILTLVVHLRDR